MPCLRWQWIAVAFVLLTAACGSSGGGQSGKDGGPGPGRDGSSPDGVSLEGSASSDASSEGSKPQADGNSGTESGSDAGVGAGASVLMYHKNVTHDGHYIDPLMTPDAAAGVKIDTTFAGNLTVPSGGVAGTVWS